GGYATRSATGDSVNIVPVTFSNVGSTDPFTGRVRLDSRLDIMALSSASTDYVDPIIDRADGVASNGTAIFTVDAFDPGNGSGPNAIKRVLILVTDSSGTRPVDALRSG